MNSMPCSPHLSTSIGPNVPMRPTLLGAWTEPIVPTFPCTKLRPVWWKRFPRLVDDLEGGGGHHRTNAQDQPLLECFTGSNSIVSTSVWLTLGPAGGKSHNRSPSITRNAMEQNSLLGTLETAQSTFKTRSGLHKIAHRTYSRKVSFALLRCLA